MSVNLTKGQKVNLSKEREGLNQVLIGLGWDQAGNKRGGFMGLFSSKPSSIDCDASALLLKNGKFAGKKDLVFFGNLKHHSGSIQHLGDNLTGAGDGDDEQIIVELSKVPAGYDKILFVVNIYQAIQRKQHFGMIKNAFCRIVDGRTNQEICKYNLTEDYSGMTALILGELVRVNGEWQFSAIGEGTKDTSLGELATRFQ